MAQNDVFRITAQFTMPESTVAQWVWHYRQATAGSSLNQQFLDGVEANLALAWAEIDQLIDPEVVGDTLELAVYDPVLGQFDTLLSNDISSLAGIATNEMLPHQEAAITKFFTNLGRSLGKKFVFGISENQQDNSILIASAVTALVNYALQFDDTITAGGNDYDPGNFNLLSEVFRAWTGSVAVNALLGTQDRRRPGIGI